MQWTQYEPVDGRPKRFLRYKCNFCGSTRKVALSAPGEDILPKGWSAAKREGWHSCPSCQKQPRTRCLLPVVKA